MSAELTNNTLESLLDPLGWMLFRLRGALEEGLPTRIPRWVRIAAARELAPDNPGRVATKAAVTAWIELVSALHELVLDLIELADPATANLQKAERSLQDLKTILSQPLLRTALKGVAPDVELTLSGLDEPLDAMIRAVDLIPRGDDARALGAQIYALIAIKPTPRPDQPLPLMPPATLDLSGTGRLRLLAWAFDIPWPLAGLGRYDRPESITLPVARLGARWLWEGKNEDQTTVGHTAWADGASAKSVRVCELYFNVAEPVERARTADLRSIHELLEALGYFAGRVEEELRVTFHPALSQAIEVFQAVHGLPRTRLLDQDTLNQLFHLDSREMTTRRAIPLDPARWAAIPAPPPLPPRHIYPTTEVEMPEEMFVATPVEGGASRVIPLINPEADTPHEQAISVQHDALHTPGASVSQLRAGYSYGWYVAGAGEKNGAADLPPGVNRGWIQHSEQRMFPGETTLGPGFVGIERRKSYGEDWDGGTQTEGETRSGDYFFAARHQAPSTAGRTASPSGVVWPSASLGPGALVGMYQWYDLQSLCTLCRVEGSFTLRGRAAVRVGVQGAGDTASARMVIALVRREPWLKRGYRSIFNPDWVIVATEPSWFPEHNPAVLTTARKNLTKGPMGLASVAGAWETYRTKPLRVVIDDTPPILYVGLQGRAPLDRTVEDVEAYFDKVAVEWTRYDDQEERS